MRIVEQRAIGLEVVVEHMETLDKEKVAIGWISCLTTFGKGSWPRKTPQWGRGGKWRTYLLVGLEGWCNHNTRAQAPRGNVIASPNGWVEDW
jgi:hypothetical protein